MSSPVALVTGGGSGIGLAIAEHLVQFHGYKVAIADIVEARVKEQATKLGSDKCLALHFDVTDYDSHAKAFVQTFEWGGNRLDMVVLNAGIADTDSLYKDMDMDEGTGLPKPLDLATLNVNLNAVVQGVHLARHFFLEKNSARGGRIVATSSVLGLYPNHCLPLYTASKHALVGMVRALAPVYIKDNITINTLNPTLIETNLMPEAIRPLWNRDQLTPLSTALKAIDMILADPKLTGKAMELSLGEVVLKAQPEYSTPNIKWMCEQDLLWESAAEPAMPRPPGHNAQYEGPPRGQLPE